MLGAILFFISMSSAVADLPTQRRHWVQEVRRVAILYDVTRVPDNVGRVQVQVMAEAVLAISGLSDAHRAEAKEAW